MLRQILRLAVITLVINAVTACASISGPRSVTLNPGATEKVFVASTRDASGTGLSALAYSSYELTVPPSHRLGYEPRTGNLGQNQDTDFLTVAHRRFDGAAAFSRVVASKAGDVSDGAGSEVLVFVHGYNTTFEGSLARLAQIGADLDLPSALVLYAWPSDSRLSRYNEDAERAHAAQDGLADLLSSLAAKTDRIVLVGYSMGASLAVDALVRMRETGRTGSFAKLDVVLLSPDLDLEQFRSAAHGVGGLPGPIVVYGSHKDIPLKLVAQFFAHGKPRLGALPSPRLLSDVDATYVDVADVAHTGLGHFAVASAPALITAINHMKKPDLLGFATRIAPKMKGAAVTREGHLTYILLPR